MGTQPPNQRLQPTAALAPRAAKALVVLEELRAFGSYFSSRVMNDLTMSTGSGKTIVLVLRSEEMSIKVCR